MKKVYVPFLAIILFVNLFSVTIYADHKSNDFEISKVRDNGDDYNKLVIVMMGDGYTKNELEKFKDDSNKAIDSFLEEEPFKSYKKDINFYLINVISNVSGASPNKNNIRDTYFGSSFNFDNNIARLLAPTKIGRAYDCLANSEIEYDKGIIIVNSSTYGGSGGDICVTSINEDSYEILLHEFGHSFANLGDEYYAGTQYTSEAPNVTREKDPELNKWKYFMGKGNIGIYPMEEITGWYVPSKNCKMKKLYNPFCDVCKIEIGKKIILETEKEKEIIKEIIEEVEEPQISTANEIMVKINGKGVVFDQEPVTFDGRTLVPLRAIFEGLGLDVGWDEATKSVTGEKEGLLVKLKIGDHKAIVNGEVRELDVPARVINKRTTVPIRFIAESTGAKVDWDKRTKTINIMAP